VSLVDKIKDALDRRHLGDPPIELRDDGFLVGGHFTTWADVTEIRAYKIDLLTFDEIRLVFESGAENWVEISEEQPGFSEVASAMVIRFPSTYDWRSRIAQPAFATNETVLYPAA
jgi:hypothetical protein